MGASLQSRHPRLAAGSLRRLLFEIWFQGEQFRVLAGSGSVGSAPLGTAVPRQPRTVPPGEQQRGAGPGRRRRGSSVELGCRGCAPASPALLPPAPSPGTVYATSREPGGAGCPLPPPWVQHRATNLAGTQRDRAGCSGLVRSTLATGFLLGLTCPQSKPPPSEERVLPLPSPHSCLMVRRCPNTHAVISFKWMH